MHTLTITVTDSIKDQLSELNVTAQEVFNKGLADRLYRRNRQREQYAAKKAEKAVLEQMKAEHPDLFREAFEKAGLR